jgi:streptogramin lyase
VLDGLEGVVVPVDPVTLDPGDPIAVPGNAQRIAFLDELVWVLDTSAGTVTSIDPATGSLGSPVRVGEESTDLVAGGGALWVTDQGGVLWRVDPVTSASTPLEVGGPLAASTFDDASDLVWVLVVDIR